MGQLWPRSGSIERDNNDDRADDAVAYFFAAGTSTPLTVYQDGDESTPHEDPVEADSGRWPAVFVPFGSYKVIIKSAVGGTTLFSADDIPNAAPVDTTLTVDEDALYQTGDFIFTGKNGTRAGAVRCNGKTLGDATSGGTERAHADCADLFAYLWNNYLDAQAGVSTGRGATATADFAAHKTITLPDYRCCTISGFADMGSSDAGLYSSTNTVTGSGTAAGSILGQNTHQLLTTELASHVHGLSAADVSTGSGGAHTHTFSGNTGNESAHTHTGTTAVESVDHTHTYNAPTVKTATATGFGTLTGSIWAGADVSTNTSGRNATHTHTFTSNAGSAHLHSFSGTTDSDGAHTHTVSGTSGSTGSGVAHNIMQRSAIVNVMIKL